LKHPGVMSSWLGAAVTMLASPPQASVAGELPSDVLSPALVKAGREPTTEAQMWSWLCSLAAVRPDLGTSQAPSAVLLFVVIAPVGGAVGVRAIGSF
jgi:hypothetical protein